VVAWGCLFIERSFMIRCCQENFAAKVFGKVMQERCCHFKGLADVIATAPTFVFGKV
jgi:hypothetical protein